MHLARDKDASVWAEEYRCGTLVGRNDPTPYGYGRANSMGCQVSFARSGRETPLAKASRLGVRVILGFDLIHARRNRNAMLASDVVWTHTESQFLSVAAVLGKAPGRPKILGQAVWLMDRWPTMPSGQKAIVRRLMRHVDLLTTLSDLNAEVARHLFPATRVEVVRFGVPSEAPTPPKARRTDPIRVLAVGNDRHRDWHTLVAAFRDNPGVELLILSGNAPARLASNHANVTIRSCRTNDDLAAAMASATVAVVPLVPNLHASGATVVQEAVLAGLPVVASDVGGLSGYFGPDEITFVPSGDPSVLRQATLSLATDQVRAVTQAMRAQARMERDALGAEGYIRRHVELTRELLA